MKNQTETLENLIRDRELLIDASLAALPLFAHTCGRELASMDDCAKCRMIGALMRCCITCPECNGGGSVWDDPVEESGHVKPCDHCNQSGFLKT